MTKLRKKKKIKLTKYTCVNINQNQILINERLICDKTIQKKNFNCDKHINFNCVQLKTTFFLQKR